MPKSNSIYMSHLADVDPEIARIIESERLRQVNGLELIASENLVSRAVLEAMGSIMTNKYAEGYPGKRYYGGCEFHDQAENLAEVAQEVEEELEVAAGRGVLGGPYVWGLIALLVVIVALAILR